MGLTAIRDFEVLRTDSNSDDELNKTKPDENLPGITELNIQDSPDVRSKTEDKVVIEEEEVIITSVGGKEVSPVFTIKNDGIEIGHMSAEPQ